MIEIKGKSFCFTGKFETKQKGTDNLLTRKQVSDLVIEKGGVIKKSVVKSLDYLVVGGLGSNLYNEGTKGIKLEKAKKQENTKVLSEKEFFKVINY